MERFKLYFLIFLATKIVFGVYTFDYVDFIAKYCYEDSALETPSFYLPYSTDFGKVLSGFACEDFVLKKDDLDYMARYSFVLSNVNYIFFKNCEIEYFNEYLISKFPKAIGVFFDNCKLSFKNPEVLANLTISATFYHLGFHDCHLTNTSDSLALQKFKTLQDLLFQNSTFENPQTDEQFLPKLNNIYRILIDNTNIKSFHKGILANLTHALYRLTCTSCQLEEIESLLYHLKYDISYQLSFADNKLKKLPTSLNVLSKMKTLPELSLSRNEISEPLLKRIHFKSMANLKILDLSRNSNLTSLGYLAFKNTMLQKLNMSRVNLKSLNKLGNVNLINIDFSHNLISTIHPNTFEDLTNLAFLNMSHNEISNLDGSIFRSLAALKELYLTSNKLKEISDKAFTGLTTLRVLDLSSNFIKNINGIVVLTALQELYVQCNAMKTIHAKVVPNSLLLLDISHNPINYLGQYSFLNLGLLKTLNLNNVSLEMTGSAKKDFDENSFQPLKSLKTLEMRCNCLTTLENIFLPETLESLDLADNDICNVTNKTFGSLKSLQYLSLANNEIATMDKEVLREFMNIRFVDFSGNGILGTIDNWN